MKVRIKRTFIIAIIIGLASHMYRMTNWMVNEDGLNYLDSIGVTWVTSLGRYLLPIVENVRGTYEVTWLISLLSVIFMSFAAVLIVEMFDIRSLVGQVLVAWIVVANPVVTAIFSYMYTADGYFFGMMLATLSAYFAITKKDIKFTALASVSLYISLGFYQGFMTVTVMLLFIDLIMKFMNKDTKVKDVFITMLRYLVMGIVAIVAYMITVNIVWKNGGYGVTSYQGVGNEQSSSVHRYITAVKDSYIDFARVFLVRWEWTFYNKTNILMFISSGLMIVIGLSKKKLWKQPVRWLMIIALLGLMPIGTHVFEFISEELSYTSTSMEYGTMMVFLLPVILANNFECGKEGRIRWKDKAYLKKNFGYVGVMVLMVLMVLNFSIIANKAYYNIDIANRKVENVCNRVLTRIEMTEGYTYDMPVMIAGSRYEIPEYVTNAPMMSGVVANHFFTGENDYMSYMRKVCDAPIVQQSRDIEKEIALTDEFKNMGTWPDVDSVKIINGTVVVVLSRTDLDYLYE